MQPGRPRGELRLHYGQGGTPSPLRCPRPAGVDMARTGTGLSRLVGTSGRRGHVRAPREPAWVPVGPGVQASLRRFAAWTPSAWGVLRARSTTVPQAGLDREIRRQISLSIAIQWEVCRQTSLSERKRLVTWPDPPCRRQPAGSRRPGRSRPGRWVPGCLRLRHLMDGEGGGIMGAEPGSTWRAGNQWDRKRVLDNECPPSGTLLFVRDVWSASPPHEIRTPATAISRGPRGGAALRA